MESEKDQQDEPQWPERLQGPEFEPLHRAAEGLAKALMGRPPKTTG